MSQRMRWRLAGWLIVTLGALTLLAAALPSVRLEAGKPFPYDLFTPPALGRPSAPGGFAGMEWMGMVLLTLGAFVVVMTIFSRDFRRWLVRNLPMYLLVMLTVYLLMANLRPPLFEPRSAPGQASSRPDQSSDVPEVVVPPDLVTNPPAWLVTAISLAIAAGIALAAWRVVRRFPKRTTVTIGDDIVASAQAALRDLEAGADVRDAVTRCYVEMVRVLHTERGIVRDPDMTAREFEQRLARTSPAAPSICRLTRLFEAVRYSPRPPGPREAREAEACLRGIIEAYQSHHGRQ
ncbi:MAG: DUF4129 domain-containing protein [Roseiflexaceae bacterium]|nr:DUF4129 domain-containing protein [Roseiflexus sp.]MDW8212984.1 DUF4129 domain-containing protein [Roseiflexaceae bacterium]